MYRRGRQYKVQPSCCKGWERFPPLVTANLLEGMSRGRNNTITASEDASCTITTRATQLFGHRGVAKEAAWTFSTRSTPSLKSLPPDADGSNAQTLISGWTEAHQAGKLVAPSTLRDHGVDRSRMKEAQLVGTYAIPPSGPGSGAMLVGGKWRNVPAREGGSQLGTAVQTG